MNPSKKMKTALNRRSFLLALGLAVVLLVPYEWYWRTQQHYPPTYDSESLDHWADIRSTVDDLDSTDVVILGSSRAHFDLNIYLWEELTGTRPVQLGYPGSSPYHPVEDMVRNTQFNGLLVIGVSPGLFYTMDGSWGANRGKAFVDQYHNRTYAQIFSQRIFHWIDPLFSYVESGMSYKTLVDYLPFKNREGVRDPMIWPPMVHVDHNRNVRMLPIMETDSVMQQRQKDIWYNPNPKNRFKDSIDVIMDHYVGLAKEFQARGGRVAFVRAPVTDYYLETEAKLYPRTEYWDRLIRECGCPGYHFADHPDTKGLVPPEWSHLNRKDSDIYTRVIVDLLKKDQFL